METFEGAGGLGQQKRSRCKGRPEFESRLCPLVCKSVEDVLPSKASEFRAEVQIEIIMSCKRVMKLKGNKLGGGGGGGAGRVFLTATPPIHWDLNHEGCWVA